MSNIQCIASIAQRDRIGNFVRPGARKSGMRRSASTNGMRRFGAGAADFVFMAPEKVLTCEML